MSKVGAATKGIETCVPGGDDQTDWDNWATRETFVPITWMIVAIGGSGGYATGLNDCICFQSVEYWWVSSWTQNGEEGSVGDIELDIIHDAGGGGFCP